MATKTESEFWWLNNGITILADKCNSAAFTFQITTPQIVNGLQTSYEIFSYFNANPDARDDRCVLVRVILPKDEKSRSDIIKATNSQTPVSALSLKVMDRIHFDIEDRLKLHSIYYDRRKGYYKRLEIPIDQVVSVQNVAQAVMAIVLQSPDDARARPGTVIKNPTEYKRLFVEGADANLYVVCTLIDRRAWQHLLKIGDLKRDTKADIRYYVSMWIGITLTQTWAPTVDQLIALEPTLEGMLTPSVIDQAIAVVTEAYRELGGNDKVAKGVDLKDRLLREAQIAYDQTII